MLAPLSFNPDAAARDRILDTAQRLFYACGIRATGIDKVIAEAQVTKVTFYRHFPAKNQLILAFLAQRHLRWMKGFSAMLDQYPDIESGLPAALQSWFSEQDYRGCAFINVRAELGDAFPEATQLIRQHKQAMAEAIAQNMPQQLRNRTGQIMLLAEGAIVRVQTGEDSSDVISDLRAALRAILRTEA